MNNDTPDIVPGQVAIVDPSGHVLNKRAKPEPRPKYGPDGKRIMPPGDFMSGVPSRNEIMDHLGAAAVAVGQKLYDQLAEETTAHLEEMEHLITQRVLAEMERRSLLGRIRTRWLVAKEWARGYAMEVGLVSPIAPAPEVKLVEEAPSPPERQP